MMLHWHDIFGPKEACIPVVSRLENGLNLAQ
jgi:hypothetical protein